MAITGKKKVYFEVQEYDCHNSGYSHAQITIIVRDSDKKEDVPYFGCGTLCRIRYQRNKEESGSWSKYYGEEIEDLKPEYNNLSVLSDIFSKMEKYSDKIYSQGLTLNVYPAGDLFKQRVLLLIKTGATQIYIDRNLGHCEYSLSPVPA